MTPEGLTITALSEVEPEAVRWLWNGRVPYGKYTALVGDPGGGKSWTSLAIASAVSHGRALPDGEKIERGSVLFVCYEDGLADTIRPRAQLCGADLTRLLVAEGPRLESGSIEPFGTHHLAELDRFIEAHRDVRALVIDPIANLIGADLRQGSDAEVRAALNPLKLLAERHAISVIGVLHLRKQDAEKTLYRVSGSIAYVALARSVLLVARDDATGRRSISSIKSSLSTTPPPIEFAIDEDGFAWRGVANDLTAENMLAPGRTIRASAPAEAFLRETLAAGPLPTTRVLDEGKKLGFSRDQLHRAKEHLEVVAFKPTFRSSWQWRLREDGDHTAQSSRSSRSSSEPATEGATFAPKIAPDLHEDSKKCAQGSEDREDRTPRAESREDRTLAAHRASATTLLRNSARLADRVGDRRESASVLGAVAAAFEGEVLL